MDHSIRPLTPEETEIETEAERIAGDLQNNVNKAGKAHQASDARAFALQQQYAGLCLPEGQA